RARAGVPVRVLYDAVGSSLPDAYVDSPRAAGVRALPYRPVHWYSLDRAQDRSHVRAVVVDGRIGYTGGFGIADKWAGDGRHAGQWRDVNVRFSGPAVVRLQAAFLAGWAEASHELLTGSRFFPPDAPTPAGDHVAGLLYTSPGSGSTQAERFFALSITGAQRTLYITNAYFIPDAGMRRLLEAAVRRGVDVRVLTAGEKIDVKSVRYASHAHDEELLRAGVRIYEYQPSMIHSKSFVVDGVWATVGSMNFDNRATALNEESSLVVYDRRLGARLDSTFLADLRFAHEIRLSDFAQRPFYQRLLERGAVLLERLM
ncbi:MAG TPA: phospholipase D-like domain-containing protein, partial [Longimicrobiaceae bacterium]|nr:phospholipase D-like domain-containing protein [Longimicrobiaceae bacterium]